MGSDRTASSNSTVQTQKWQTTPIGLGLSDGHSVRTAKRYPLADAAARVGLRLWHDLLAASARLARGRHLATDPLRFAGLARPPITGQVQFAGQRCIYSNCRALYNSYNTGLDFQPRIGFAWTPSFLDNKTVLRAAYGISSYLEGTGNNLRLPMNPPFTSPEFQTNYFTSNLPATRTGEGLLPPTTDLFQNAIIRLWHPNIQPAISQQRNLSVEHEFTGSTTLQVGYVGQHGTHLMVAMRYLQSQLHADGNITPSPFLSGNPTLRSELSEISGTASIGNMSYNALQATLQRRFSRWNSGRSSSTLQTLPF